MSKASLSNGAGPGSSISLAPETVRIRDALIKKFSDAPLDEMTNFMTVALSNETDELRRLGILAARIYILRHRVANLKEFNRNPSLTSLPEVDTTTLSHNLATASEPAMDEDVDAPNDTEQWSRIQMTEPGEVNGVRFLAGTTIDAQPQDADKLIRSKKAVRVAEDGKIIENHDDDFTDRDADANNGDEMAEVVDQDTSASLEPDDDTNAEASQGTTDADAKTDADQTQGVNEDEATVEGDQSQQADVDEAPKAPTS